MFHEYLQYVRSYVRACFAFFFSLVLFSLCPPPPPLFRLSYGLSYALSIYISRSSAFSYLSLSVALSLSLSSPPPSVAGLVPLFLCSRLFCVFCVAFGTGIGAFGRSVLEQVLSSHVSTLREELRHEMRNLHVDMLRQFHSLQVCAGAFAVVCRTSVFVLISRKFHRTCRKQIQREIPCYLVYIISTFWSINNYANPTER